MVKLSPKKVTRILSQLPQELQRFLRDFPKEDPRPKARGLPEENLEGAFTTPKKTCTHRAHRMVSFSVQLGQGGSGGYSLIRASSRKADSPQPNFP